MENQMEISYSNFFKEYPDVVSVDDLSHMLSICKVKAYELVRSGQIRSVKIGHVYRIPKKSIYQYLEMAS